MLIEEIGEFGLVDRIRRFSHSSSGLLMGPGDDAAVVVSRTGSVELLTTDMLIEDVHFSMKSTSLYQLGRKSIAVNVSDIAAMGGRPKFILVSLGLGGGMTVEAVEGFFEGVAFEAGRWGAVIAGGDIVRSGAGMVVSISVLGETREELVVTRGGASPGDLVCVTNYLGDSAAGLELTRTPLDDVPVPVREYLLERHLTPCARVAEAAVLAPYATAMMDISDGLSGDLGHMCRASGVGAEVLAYRIPISQELRVFGDVTGADVVGLALSGGEDYELLFTIPPRSFAEVADSSSSRVTCIGRTVAADRCRPLLREEGGVLRELPSSYRHF